MVVYVAFHGYDMLGIFSTYENAESYLQANEPDIFETDAWGIEEWEVDS